MNKIIKCFPYSSLMFFEYNMSLSFYLSKSSTDIVGNKPEAQESDASLRPTRPLRNKKPGPYQLSPYDLVSTGAMSKFRAGPFLVTRAVTADQLKLLQYGFNKFAEKRL